MPDEKELSVEVSLKPNDIYTPFTWSSQNLWRWVASIVLCLIVRDVSFSEGASINSMPDAQPIKWLILVVTTFIVLGLLVFPYLRFLSAFRESPSIRETRNYRFSAEGVQYKSNNMQANCKWAYFLKIFETQSAFLLLQTSYTAIHIPKRFLASKEQTNLLRQLIRENFKGKWRLRKD